MKKIRVSKISVGVVVVAIIATLAALFYIRQQYPLVTESFVDALPGHLAAKKVTPLVITEDVPKNVLLKVPFTPQAPTGNWDQLHNEACEEAVSIMANQYFSGNTEATLAPTLVEQEITKLTAWEDQNFGYNSDTTSAETAKMISSVYGLHTALLSNFTAQDLEHELAAGYLVIISENGRLLNNPNYKSPGPIHHMLLVKGYNSEGFITNDSGTRRGQNYFYTFDTMYNAAADWNHTTNTVDPTQKIAIVVWK